MLQKSVHTYNGNTKIEATNLSCAVMVGETVMGLGKPTSVRQINWEEGP